MYFREMSDEETISIEGGKGVWTAVGDFFTGLADGFRDWFMAI